MTTKIDLINLVQTHLSSGVMPKDLRGRYPIPMVSRIINACFEEIAKQDPIAKEETAQEYELTVSTDNGYYITLVKKPISGSSSFVYLKDGNKRIIVSSKGGAVTLDVLRVNNRTATLKGDKVYFPTQPSNTTITACYVANINDFLDSDIIVSNGAEKYLLESVVNIMRQNDIRPVDKINDGAVDIERK